MDVVVPINMVAIVLAALSTMVVGTLWYGPLFGKQWMAMSFTPAQIEEGKKKGMAGMWKTYVVQFIGSLLSAYVLAHILVFANAYQHSSGVTSGLTCAFWIWLGFIAPIQLANVLWENKTMKLYYLGAGYYLATFLVMGAILGAMPA